MQRQRAHPVDIGDDLDRRNDRAEVTCHRRLQRQQDKGALFGACAHRGNLLVSVITCSASTRSACSRACVARSIAAPASPHISPSWSVKASNCSWYAVRMNQAYGVFRRIVTTPVVNER